MKKSNVVLCFVGVVGLTGCFSLSKGDQPQRHYVLGAAIQNQGGSPQQDLAGVKVGVRRLQLASYLESPFIVVRQGSHQVRFSEFHRWGEQLGGGINRAVADYLAAGASFQAVDVAPWPALERYDYLIQLQISRFEGLAPDDPTATDGEAHLLATWEIVRQQDGTVLARGTTDYRQGGWRVHDYAELVTLLDAGLNVLSTDLTRSLQGLVASAAEATTTSSRGVP